MKEEIMGNSIFKWLMVGLFLFSLLASLVVV